MIRMENKMTAPELSAATDNGQSNQKFINNIITQNYDDFNPQSCVNNGFFPDYRTLEFPSELKEHGRFCCWKYKERNGQMTKVPYHPLTRKMGKSNDMDSFVPYKVARDAQGYDGIGIGIFEGICAIDLDHCVSDEGQYSETAAEIVRLMHSYTEYSPSGQGLHILFRADNFVFDDSRYYIMNRNAGIEVYVSGATNKYVTVTQNVCENYEFGDRSDELKVFLEKYMCRTETYAVNAINAVNYSAANNFSSRSTAVNAINAVNSPEPDYSLNELLQKAMSSKNGAKFSALWNGDMSGYGSQSEADMALCSHLAFWTGCDASRMDAAFRQSALMRDKWDRRQAGTTYGAETIKRAIQNCKTVYAPSRTKQNKPSPENAEPEFQPIVPLTPQVKTLEQFPLDAFPETLRNYVAAVAEHSQTAPEMAAVMALGALSVCLQGKYKVEGSPGYYEPLNLYVAVVAEPGERKSSVLRAMTKDLVEYADDFCKQRNAEIKKNQRQRGALERKISAVQKRLEAELNPLDEEILQELEEELDSIPEKKPVRFFADDCSSEALTSLMAANNGVLSVISSEGGIFDIMAGRYSNSANIDVWLKGHCGDPIHIDRLGRAAETIVNPVLSAILTIQPSVLENIMSNKTMTGRGLVARFLYAMPPSRIGSRSFVVNPIPSDVESAYRNLIFHLMAVPKNSKEQILTLSDDAVSLMSAYFQQNERYLTGEGRAISDWASKYIGAVLRIAGLLHAASVEERALEISASTIKKAIMIGEFFKSQAHYAYSMMGKDLEITKAEFVLGKIKGNRIKEIKRSDLFQICRGKLFKKTEEIFPIVDMLAEHGYVRTESPQRKTAGRPADVRVIVNPVTFLE